MMNMKDENANLGLGMDSTQFCIRRKLLSSSGAGVNAESRVNLNFGTSDPLSELMWSPSNGLSLKCATSAAVDTKPFLLWNVGPSRDDAAANQGNYSVSPTMLDVDDMIIDKETLLKASESHHTRQLGTSHHDCDGFNKDRIMEAADKNDVIWEEENCMVHRGANPHMDVIGNQITDVSPEPQLKKRESSAENDLSRLIENEDLGGSEMPRENALPADGSPTGSRVCSYQENGKGKALSAGDIYRRSSDDEDGSHESADSCNSAGLSSKGINGVKRHIYDKGVMLGSKRMKMQIHGSHGSTTVTGPDSSFMNWISNMSKGLSDCNKEEFPAPLSLACFNDVCGKNCHEKFMCFRQQDSASSSMGFQTIFQSLCCKEAKAINNGGKKIFESIKESRDHGVDDQKLPENLPGSHDSDCDNSSQHTLLCNKHVDPKISANFESSLAKKSSEDLLSDRAKAGVVPPHALDEEIKITAKEAYTDFPVAMSDVLVKCDPRISLWITRLSSKAPKLEKGKVIAEETIGCSSSCPKVDLGGQMNVVLPIEMNSSEGSGASAESKLNASMTESRNFIMNSEASFTVKSISKLRPIRPSQRFSSEAMASVFARRLDALRHITSAKTGKLLAWSQTCFFCGDYHDTHECPHVTKSELEDLLLKLSTLEGVEESSSLCIRCCQSDHWAVSCPLAPSGKQRISEQKGTGCSSRMPVLGYFPNTYEGWKLEISSTTKDNRTSPVFDDGTLQNTVVKSQIFDAVRNLRLNRADILRWMNSNGSSSHLNGFFLRLRVGKLVGGSSYYVASVAAGDGRESDGATSILVDVGGIKSYVASQYVSNHDFMEDEMEAWWCRSIDNGGGVPSLAHLNSKLNHRQTLGF